MCWKSCGFSLLSVGWKLFVWLHKQWVVYLATFKNSIFACFVYSITYQNKQLLIHSLGQKEEEELTKLVLEDHNIPEHQEIYANILPQKRWLWVLVDASSELQLLMILS